MAETMSIQIQFKRTGYQLVYVNPIQFNDMQNIAQMK